MSKSRSEREVTVIGEFDGFFHDGERSRKGGREEEKEKERLQESNRKGDTKTKRSWKRNDTSLVEEREKRVLRLSLRKKVDGRGVARRKELNRRRWANIAVQRDEGEPRCR